MRKMTLLALVLGGSLIACDGKSSDGDKGTAPQAPPNAQPEDAGETLASVNGADIGSKAFEQAAARKSPAEGDNLSDEEKREVLDRLVDEELLYQEALRQGLDQDPKVKKVMVNTLLRQEVYGSVRNSDFTDEELQAYYEAHMDEFVVPEKVQIRRILIKSGDERPEAEAKSLAEDLRGQIASNPGKFKELATKHSEDPYRRRGGDVGFVPRSGKPGLDQGIVDKAFEMEVEAVSEVFTTDEGFNIIMVANRRERVERTYQQMKGSVLRKVKNEKLAEMYEQYTDNLQTSGTVNVDEAKLSATEVGAARRGAPAALGPDGAGLTPPSLPTLGGAGEDGAAPNGAEGAEGAEGAGKDAPSGDKEGDK
jgi:parvulin-like peptidyl-prolyl isomerase